MAQTLTCWKCGASLAHTLVPFARTAECARCGADLHVCRMCEFFDPGVRQGCKEPVADEVSDRERANFCGYLVPVAGLGPGAPDGEARAARAELDALFGLSSASRADVDGADAQRRELDALFGSPDKD